MAESNQQKDALPAAKQSRDTGAGVTVKGLCNAYLNYKDALLESGELSPRTRQNYQEAANRVFDRFGKTRPVSGLGQGGFAELRKWMAKNRPCVARSARRGDGIALALRAGPR
jgi:hypothetical protein